MRLKRWESPRRKGRNHKGRGGTARQKQLKKQQQMLRKKLKEGNKLKKDNQANTIKLDNKKKERQGEDYIFFPLIFFFPTRDNIVCHCTLHSVWKWHKKSYSLDKPILCGSWFQKNVFKITVLEQLLCVKICIFDSL